MTSSKTLCAICHKAAGVFTCNGCTNRYCMDHVNEHRQILENRMDEIITQRDELLQIIIDRQVQINQHSLIKQINQWEKESIEKIQQIAQNTRQQLFDLINKDTLKISKDIENLTEQLSKAREYKDYVEPELKIWTDKINTLKNDLHQTQMIHIQSDNKQTPLIFNISITEDPKDLFENCIGDIKIEDNGQVIKHGQTSQFTSVRCRNEYSSDIHQFQFKIEKLNEGKYFFLGIVSKTIPLQLNSNETPTIYGWSTYNNISLNGKSYMSYNGYKSDMEINDIIELVIDCNKKKIRLINHRTKSINDLHIDILQCPFPWKINLGLY